MRIVAGAHRGRKIESPKGKQVRPTAEHCREALFNLLMHRSPDNHPVIDQTVMDLCCGTGALGLEALSRGADHAIFVDQSQDSIALAQYNCAQLKETDRATFIQSSAISLHRATQPVALVMMDAPYHSGIIKPTYDNLRAQGWLRPGTIIAFEQNHKEPFPELDGVEIITQRTYGKTKITLVEVEG